MNPKLVTIETIKLIAKILGELNDYAVFIGGATLPFYLPEVYLSQARPTEDIDIVMEVVGRNRNRLNEEALRLKGFKHDISEGAPTCRWTFEDFKIDIMSSDVSALGFTNKWYEEGISKAIEIINEPVSVRIFSLPYFLASKIEAFKSRGHSDFMGSKDMGDIISVLEVSPVEMLEGAVSTASDDLQSYLKKELNQLLKKEEFTDAIHGAAFNRTNTTEAERVIKNRIAKLVSSFSPKK